MLLWTLSIAALVGGLALTGTMAWLERRPRKTLMPSIIPTTPVMFAGIIIAVLAIAHMLALSGVGLPSR